MESAAELLKRPVAFPGLVYGTYQYLITWIGIFISS